MARGRAVIRAESNVVHVQPSQEEQTGTLVGDDPNAVTNLRLRTTYEN